MKKAIRTALAGVLMVPMLALGLSVGTGTVDVAAQISEGISDTRTAEAGQETDLGAIIVDVINIMLYIVAILAVIMIIYGGIRYTTSGGNQTHVTAGKNSLLYAIVGLIVAILAWAIVNFVASQFGVGV